MLKDNKMTEKWQSKIEQDIKELTKATIDNSKSTAELTGTIKAFIEHSQELQEVKFAQVEKRIEDHEQRIRYNTKFVYQSMAAISLLSVLISYAMRLL